MTQHADTEAQGQAPGLHLGIIMDGNGRWAVERGMPRLYGHRKGARRVKEIVSACPDLGVGTLTLYAFSTENWKRAAHEVKGLMRLFRGYLTTNMVELHENNVRVRFIGDPAPLAADIRALMEKTTELTAKNTGLVLNVAINYGGRDELRRAVSDLAARAVAGDLEPGAISEEDISLALDTGGQPDPDLILRTAGEERLSNFMLWQVAYSEFAFIPECWPEVDPALLGRVLEGYGKRTRQFGAVADRKG